MPPYPPVRVYLRPIGTPLTIGMSGLAIASLIQSGYDLSWVSKQSSTDLGLTLIAAPFVLQLLASVYCYLARDGAAGAALGVLATGWLSIGLVHVTSPAGAKSGPLGLLLIASGGVLMLSSVAISSAKPLPGTVFMLAGIRFLVTGVFELGLPEAWQHAAGITGLVVLALACYCVLTFDLEGQHRRQVLPTFRRGSAKAALHADTGPAVGDVLHDPGVRRTT